VIEEDHPQPQAAEEIQSQVTLEPMRERCRFQLDHGACLPVYVIFWPNVGPAAEKSFGVKTRSRLTLRYVEAVPALPASVRNKPLHRLDSDVIIVFYKAIDKQVEVIAEIVSSVMM